jgi:hypothetical protein
VKDFLKLVFLETEWSVWEGLLGVGAVAGLGLVVLPYRRKQQAAQLHQLLGDLSKRLASDLESHMERHMLAVASQTKLTAQPFAAYVAATSEQLAKSKMQLMDATKQVDVLLSKIK